MLDGLFRSNFRTKCKSLLNRTKTRLEVIKKRRNAMQKFLKKDIAELLKSNLETNAYGRAEGLYMEMNMSSCYEYIEQCCNYITENLKEMHKQSECPEQCRGPVSSLNYAAARFADLPELRDLRNLFNDKYGNALEPFANKEFTERLKSRPPTTQMKLQLMQEIAQEYSVTWDPLHLEKQLQTSSLSTQEKSANLFRNRSTMTHGKGKQTDNDKQISEEEALAAKTRRRNSISGLKQNSNAENNLNRKPFANRIAPSPYTISNTKEDSINQKTEDEDSVTKTNNKPRPRSVRTKFSMSSISTSSTSSSSTSSEFITEPRESLSARVPQRGHGLLSDDEEDEDEDEEEEEKYDKLLTLFGKKKGTESCYTPRKDDNGAPKGELPPPPGRRRYLFSDNQSETPLKEDSEKRRFLPPGQKQYPIRQVRSTSLINEEMVDHHVHPKMPDFDTLAERIAVLKHV
ncbi:IST1-like protein [Bienertia sinuspersici]